MPRTVLLRFGDFGHDTVRAHLDVIRMRGSTWWGWWKKEFEPDHRGDLAALRQAVPFEIGLFQSRQDRYYVATCVEMRIASEIGPVPSPDADLTPEYYRLEKVPAWFRLTAIDMVDAGVFSARFGEIPERHETFFLVDDTGRDPRVEDARIPTPELTESPGDVILHLSDLHFGDDHGYVAPAKPPRVSLLDRLREVSESLSRQGRRIGIVVVSGDLTSKGVGFPAAEEFLDELRAALGLTVEHFVITPGNHDIDLESARPVDFSHERPYLQFARSFYVKDITQTHGVQSFVTSSGHHVHFATLNSVRLREPHTKDYGFVGSDLYEPLLEKVATASTAPQPGVRTVRIAVLHHHVLPTSWTVAIPEPGEAASLTLDAGGLLECCQMSHIDMVLHGHQHVPFLAKSSRARLDDDSRHWRGLDEPVHVIGNGSSGVRVERLDPQLPYNTVGLYEVQRNGVSVEVLRFNTANRPSPHVRTFIEAGQSATTGVR